MLRKNYFIFICTKPMRKIYYIIYCINTKQHYLITIRLRPLWFRLMIIILIINKSQENIYLFLYIYSYSDGCVYTR